MNGLEEEFVASLVALMKRYDVQLVNDVADGYMFRFYSLNKGISVEMYEIENAQYKTDFE